MMDEGDLVEALADVQAYLEYLELQGVVDLPLTGGVAQVPRMAAGALAQGQQAEPRPSRSFARGGASPVEPPRPPIPVSSPTDAGPLMPPPRRPPSPPAPAASRPPAMPTSPSGGPPPQAPQPAPIPPPALRSSATSPQPPDELLATEVEPEEDPNQVSLLAGITRKAPRLEREHRTPFPGPPPADRAAALAALREEIGDCHRCTLWPGRSCLVFGGGSAAAKLMVIGAGPGEAEEGRGEPFAGAVGQMLDRILENVLGLKRGEIYVTDAVKCRAPGDRTPLAEEITTCRPFLIRQVEVVRPKLIITMGRLATWALLETSQPLPRLRGHWFDYRGIPVMPTYHPSELMLDPGRKRPVFEDMKEVRSRLDALTASG